MLGISMPDWSETPSAIMKPSDEMDDIYSHEGPQSLSQPDVTLTNERYTSLTFNTGISTNGKSYLLLDGKEKLKAAHSEDFLRKLGCEMSTKVKVVSIFGNTGDGKSHTLNQVFFGGTEVFSTSPAQESCTLGVWAAFDPATKVVCLDTEGLLGATSHENQRTRLLLKVLAVSDVVIYRTRSERLHSDMFRFLGWASRAYASHFQGALAAVGARGNLEPAAALGPAVIVFQETQCTRPLQPVGAQSVEERLREGFASRGLDVSAFSSLRYVGTQTSAPPTNFERLSDAVRAEVDNVGVRSPRLASLVYNMLKAVNDKFSGALSPSADSAVFPEQYFTCGATCRSCQQRCVASMGHNKEGLPHSARNECRFQHQFGNCRYICKVCHTNGERVIVTEKATTSNESSWFGLAKYAWSGSVIECSKCGEIYRSRQFWYGNKSPEDAAVRTEILHMWPGTASVVSSQHAAQKVWDGVSFLGSAVAAVSAPPAKALSAWVADQIAPAYWMPNHMIKACTACSVPLSPEAKHHCRACGNGFCAACSAYEREVPSRGWPTPVRVCRACLEAAPSQDTPLDVDQSEVTARKCGEAVVSTVSAVAAVLDYPKELIKESVRPAYWVPDDECVDCAVCSAALGPLIPLHHCRSCGRGVCDDCSLGRRAVVSKGWDSPVRVCDQCMTE